MTTARSKHMDVSGNPWNHLESKAVRGAFLLKEGEVDRKQWIGDRLKFLDNTFAVESPDSPYSTIICTSSCGSVPSNSTSGPTMTSCDDGLGCFPREPLTGIHS